jgi:DNA processing protein
MTSFSEHTPEELLGSLNDLEEKHAPKKLYVAGDVSLLDAGPRVAIVGTRKPSPEGTRRAEDLAEALVKAGAVVVSGLAEGIDTAAHTAAIRSGGHTIAVLGTPLDKFVPASNRDLQQTIMRDHLVVSQFPPGTPPRRTNFPQRNRTMALLCGATVIVEAGESSGTKHQGWEALRLGRLLFLMESLAKREDLKWPSEMLGYGAQVLSRENLAAVLEALPEVPRERVAL